MLSRKDIKALLAALLRDRLADGDLTTEDLNGFFCHQLSGGYSGSFVALLWLDKLPTLILKAGSSDGILAECNSRARFESPALDLVNRLGLAGYSDEVEVEVAGRDETWRAMVYAYIGGLTYEDLASFSDFQVIFDDFVAPQHHEGRPSPQALRTWLNRLCEQIKQRESAYYSDQSIQRVRAKPLAEFLPTLPWRPGLTAVLQSAACYAPNAEELLGLRDWWDAALRSLGNVRPVHFLRPVTRRSVPDLATARRILAQIQAAGATATVAVGLKMGPGVDLTAEDLSAITGNDAPQAGSQTEYFPADSRLALLEAARILDYPLYFNTSCAVALATERPETLGTWRAPMRWSRCEPCNCVRAQRERCDGASASQVVPGDSEIAGLPLTYGLPEHSLSWLGAESAIHLRIQVDQYVFNRLIHALPYRIKSQGVKPQEAWVGPFVQASEIALADISEPALSPGARTSELKWRDELELAPKGMHKPLERLMAITGFATTLHENDDPRALAFARYFHVRRVSWLAGWLADQQGDGLSPLNRDRLAWLAWGHDLNRWPFAHNSEKGYFDQATDLKRYLSAQRLLSASAFLGYDSDAELITDLQGIVAKRATVISAEARIVLLADMISGFIEDPLLAVTGIDLRLEVIPSDIGAELAFPLDDLRFRQELYELSLILHDKLDPVSFISEFDLVFRRRAVAFIAAHSLTSQETVTRNSFNELRTRIKESFLRKRLFPYNNEKISHGSLLRSGLTEPLLKILGSDSDRVLTTISENELLQMSLENGIITAAERRRYFPDLDYVSAHEPELSFRQSCRSDWPRPSLRTRPAGLGPE